MGVYIKGAKMPINCDECPCWWADAEGWGMSYCKAGSKYTESPEVECDKRPNDCPLVEVPEPHGRLIDADEITAFMGLERNGEEVESLDEFPTVIEAEGEG